MVKFERGDSVRVIRGPLQGMTGDVRWEDDGEVVVSTDDGLIREFAPQDLELVSTDGRWPVLDDSE